MTIFITKNKDIVALSKEIIKDTCIELDINYNMVKVFYYDETHFKDGVVSMFDTESQVILINYDYFRANDISELIVHTRHEMRHLFQYLCATSEDFRSKTNITKDIAQRWLYEFKNYVKPYESKSLYQEQSIEIDATSFSYEIPIDLKIELVNKKPNF